MLCDSIVRFSSYLYQSYSQKNQKYEKLNLPAIAIDAV